MSNEFLPFGIGPGSNVITQAEYDGLLARLSGFIAGVAMSEQLNKVWRQSSVMSAMVGQFISDHSLQDALDNGNISQLLTRFEVALRRQDWSYATAGGSANALTLTLAPAPTNYAIMEGSPIRVKIATNNTAAATINVNTLGVKNIVRADGTASAARDLIAGSVIQLVYDGTNFQIQNNVEGAATMLDTQVFGSSVGAISWTCPADGLYEVTVAGAGAGGGGNNGTTQGASGGNGGGAAVGRFAYTKGQVVTGFIGQGGSGGAGGGGTGGAGQTTSFGGVISATSGAGGLASGNVNGGGGIGSGGEINFQGMTPQVGGTTLFGGPGAHGPLGMGSGGNAGSGVQNGSGYGAGGSGAGPSTSNGGGIGSNGLIIVKRVR
ncbi:hypothetical protein AB4099_19095 [Bosea sp. 2KB_26]|uniref:hypothetical protein n=1 Tax=Bosea sp. 2KB_26 TaxID=3237475 RepID=UPI003F8EF71C